MAINRISGNILQSDLRRGDNLAFQGNLVYINVLDTRVGINTDSTTHTLTVTGNAIISGDLSVLDLDVQANITADIITANTLAVGNIEIGNVLTGGNLVINSLVVNTTSQLGNVFVSNTDISLATAANLTLIPTGNNLLIMDTTSAMLLPLGNTIQRPVTPITGLIRYNEETTKIEFYDGAQWQDVATSTVTNQTLNGDGVSVVFVLNQNSTTAASLVSMNGVLQLPTVAYAVAGNLLTFTEAPLSTDVIDVRFL